MSVREAEGLRPASAVEARDAGTRPGPLAALLDHLRDPMRRSSYALILGTGLTSALGLLFWMLAARWLPPATVGIGAALVSAISFLASLSTLGLRNGFVRFLPEAGSTTRRLIASGYAICAGVGLLTAGVFLLGQPWWAERLAFLRSSPLASVAFMGAVAVWVIFILQDHVLLGLRRTGWVPVANGVSSAAKIVLLPVLAFSTAWAIFAATLLPVVVVVLAVTVLVLRRPKQVPSETATIPVARLVRFAATDHLAALLWMGTANIVTLMILQRVGPEASAYYYVAEMIGYSLYLITTNVGSALIAEGARFPERTVTLARQAVVNAARLVVPLAMAGVLLAPFLLRLLGPEYADNGTLLLQLILVSAIPQIFVAVAMSTARLRHDLRMIAAVYLAQALGVIGGSWLLLPSWGISGVGIAGLVTASGLAIVLLMSGRSGLWSERPGWRGAVAQVGRLGAMRRRHRSRRELRRRLAPALQACEVSPSPLSHTLLTSECDSLIAALDDRPLLVKIATSPAASTGLDRHADTLDLLRDRPEVRSLTGRLPRVVRRGVVAGNRVLVETRLPGRRATVGAADGTAALAAISELHASTAERRTVDAEMLRDWVDEPLAALRRLPSLARHEAAMDRLTATLHEAFAGRELLVSATHGDFWPGNVLVTDDGEGPRVTGIVDWENARRIGLPDTDLLHWWLTTQPVELGAAVRNVLASPPSRNDLPAALPNPQLDVRTTIVLTWLWHVSAGLNRATRNSLGPVWVARNVKPVVRRFDHESPITDVRA